MKSFGFWGQKFVVRLEDLRRWGFQLQLGQAAREKQLETIVREAGARQRGHKLSRQANEANSQTFNVLLLILWHLLVRTCAQTHTHKYYIHKHRDFYFEATGRMQNSRSMSVQLMNNDIDHDSFVQPRRYTHRTDTQQTVAGNDKFMTDTPFSMGWANLSCSQHKQTTYMYTKRPSITCI